MTIWGDKHPANELSAAAQSGDLRAIKACIAVPCCGIDIRDGDGWSPLHYAVYSKQADAVRLLLELGADPNAREQRGGTPLHWACEVGDLPSVKHLVRFAADLNAKDQIDRVPLDDALFHGHWEIVEFLSAAGVDWSLVTAFIPERGEQVRAVLRRTAALSRSAADALERMRDDDTSSDENSG